MFGDEVQEFAERMINCGFADFIGSDAHDLRMRNTDISFCLDNYPYGMNEDVLEKILYLNPSKIHKDEKITTNRLCYFAEV
jgi:tyrosine-protein phosphatase YwqE